MEGGEEAVRPSQPQSSFVLSRLDLTTQTRPTTA
jgi:hypothetical protein